MLLWFRAGSVAAVIIARPDEGNWSMSESLPIRERTGWALFQGWDKSHVPFWYGFHKSVKNVIKLMDPHIIWSASFPLLLTVTLTGQVMGMTGFLLVLTLTLTFPAILIIIMTILIMIF